MIHVSMRAYEDTTGRDCDVSKRNSIGGKEMEDGEARQLEKQNGE